VSRRKKYRLSWTGQDPFGKRQRQYEAADPKEQRDADIAQFVETRDGSTKACRCQSHLIVSDRQQVVQYDGSDSNEPESVDFANHAPRGGDAR
jgi:hypothetical protein